MIANIIHLVSLFSLPYPAGSFLGFVLHTLLSREEEEEEEEAKLMDGIDLIDKHTPKETNTVGEREANVGKHWFLPKTGKSL